MVLMFMNGKWHVHSADGRCWCAFTEKKDAVKAAIANGWKFIERQQELTQPDIFDMIVLPIE